MLAKQVATCPVHFALVIFGDDVSQTICLGLASNHNPPDLSLASI
jgi:hypothetical protein